MMLIGDENGTVTGAAVITLAGALAFGSAATAMPGVNLWDGPTVAIAPTEFTERLKGTSGATPDPYPSIVLRTLHSVLLDDPNVAAAVTSACGLLRERLGFMYKFVAEELTSPDDDESEPRLFVSVLVQHDDEQAMLEIENFILSEWVKQPVQIREVVRIGGEFV